VPNVFESTSFRVLPSSPSLKRRLPLPTIVIKAIHLYCARVHEGMAFCSAKSPLASRHPSKKLESIVILMTIAVCSEPRIHHKEIWRIK
jgi:hypothetical protein